MIENARLSIVNGGYYHCTPKWSQSRESYNFGQYFAYFLPVSGGAVMETTDGECELKPGNLYFIPGHHMVRQTCEKQMLVYWINFVSESFYLYYRLLGIRKIHQWPVASVPVTEKVFRRFTEFFEEAETDHACLRQDPPAGLSVQIEGVLMYLTGNLIETTEIDFQWGDFSGLDRLKPAIDFMDEHYLRNPMLAEIAGCVHLAPNYFHRYFRSQTGVTPFKYMENRRLDLARKLLFNQRLNVTEVAQQAGYESLYYFSRAFRRRFGLSPSRLRQTP